MQTRLRLITTILAVPIGLSLVLVGVHYLRQPNKRAILESIKEGMNRSEIESKLGGPPGDYTTKKWVPIPGSGFIMYETWIFDEGMLKVYFDENDQAIAVYLIELQFWEKTLLERVSHWLFG